MKKIFNLICLLLIASFSFAQGAMDDDSKAILTKVKANYESLSTVKADFSLNINNTEEEINETMKGTFFAQGKKYKVTTEENIIISDHTTRWIYSKQMNEVQISDFDEEDETFMSPATLLKVYDKDFLYRYLNKETKNGVSCDKIELTPNKKSEEYFKILVWVNPKTSMITQMKVFTKDGGRHTLTINKWYNNSKISTSEFVFDVTKYPGIEIIDLR